MIALPVRQILTDAPDIISIPPEMRHRPIEVIFKPLNEPAKTQTSFNIEKVINDIRSLIAETKPVERDSFQLDLTDFHFDRNEANAR
jgi:hypothetical protein